MLTRIGYMSENNNNMLPIDTLLRGGTYKVTEQLKSGGFGNTYVVTNINFNERWAMKEFFMKGISERDDDTCSVNVSSASKPQFESQRDKFKKEARRLRRLHHPGIVHVEDLFDEFGTSYYIMDYIGGGSLSEAIKLHGPLSEQRVRQLLPQLLDALETVHNQKIWHLDLKPGNILIKEDGQPVLIDFGASKQLGLSSGDSTSTSMTYTKGYAPSEQVDQNLDRIGPWTDLFALGATLYNLLSGNVPPLVSEIQEAESEAFNFPEGLSEQMRQLILWMMNPNRRKRPQSVAEVREFLDIDTIKSTTDIPDIEDFDRTAMPENGSKDTPTTTGLMALLQQKKRLFMAIAAALLFCIVIMVWPKSCKPDEPAAETHDITQEVIEEIMPKTVTNLTCTSAIGNYSYTGPVDNEGRPHGSGKAEFPDGRTYSGPFLNGVMEGTNAHFRMANGDTFDGEFQDNRFHEGRYTVNEDGSYFQGTFKNGQPDKGNWYDKNGKRL